MLRELPEREPLENMQMNSCCGRQTPCPGPIRALVPDQRLMHTKAGRLCSRLKDRPDAAVAEDIRMGVGSEDSIELGEDLRPALVGKHLEPLTKESATPIELIRRIGHDQIDAFVGEVGQELAGIGLHQANQAALFPFTLAAPIGDLAAGV